MRLLKYSVSAAHSKGDHACNGERPVCFADFSQGVLLRGLPFHLDKRRGTHPGPLLAPLLSGTRLGQRNTDLRRTAGEDQLSCRRFGAIPNQRAATDMLLVGELQ